jgi:hypothetical protein
MDREEGQKVIRVQGRDQEALGECEPEGHRVAVAPCAQRGAPRIKSLRGVNERKARSLCGASSLETKVMVGICPVDPDTGRQARRLCRGYASSAGAGSCLP